MKNVNIGAVLLSIKYRDQMNTSVTSKPQKYRDSVIKGHILERRKNMLKTQIYTMSISNF